MKKQKFIEMKIRQQAKMTFATMIIVICTGLFSCKKVLVPVAPDKSNLSFTASRAVYPSPLAGNVLSWFNQMQLPNGLLQSAEHSNFVSLYDNALAALVFTSQGEYAKAEAIFDFFNNRINSEFLVGPGGYYQARDSSGTPYASNRWLGDNAWLLIALNNYAASVNPSKYQNLSSVLTTWIRGLQDANGGVRGGTTPNGSPIGPVTEGMIDAFNAVNGYDNFHKNILQFLQANRWNANEKLLIASPGSTYQYALDNNCWGYCAFEGFPTSTLQKADMYKNTQIATVNGAQVTGFAPDIDKDIVWPEGTGQMVVAFQKAGQTDQANFYFDEMSKIVIPSSNYPSAVGIPYASNPGTGYGTDPLWPGADINPCISSGAWFLFASSHFDPMALGYTKNIPAPDKFWSNESTLNNGGFETGSQSPWSSYGSTAVSSSNQYAGNYCASIGADNSGFEYVISGLSPNTSYTFRGYVKSSNGTQTYINVRDYGGNLVSVSTTNTSYTKLSVPFTTGSANTSARLFFYRWNSGTGQAYGDDFEIYQTPAVINGNFESGNKSPWTGYGSNSVVSGNQYAGSYCANIGADNSGIEYLVTGLRPNTSYTFRGYVKSSNGTTAYINARDYGGNLVSASTTGTSYTQLSVPFTTGSVNTSARLFFYRWNSGTGQAYGDDFEIIEN